jgi:predicted RNA-binding protein (virulence factor B family)
MLNIGTYNLLSVDRITPHGAFLVDDNNENDILLPKRYIDRHTKVGQQLEVFVYKDSEDRLVATTERPLLKVNEFGFLKVRDVNNIGAFLDWGLSKDLLVPFREQKAKMKQNQWYLVYLYLDPKSERLAATAKVDKYFEKALDDVQTGDEVSVLVGYPADIGINVVVDNKYRGMIFQSEIYQDLLPGERTTGYVRNVREDGKLDISLRRTGMDQLTDAQYTILDELEDNNGFLPLHDKSTPDEIQSTLQMSKKTFKKSIGMLYKQKKITISDKGIKLKTR